MISITKHAQDKFKERYKIKTFREMVSIANCALKNGLAPEGKYKKLIQQGYQTFVYKELMDNIYIFEDAERRMVLITLYPKKYEGPARKKPF